MQQMGAAMQQLPQNGTSIAEMHGGPSAAPTALGGKGTSKPSGGKGKGKSKAGKGGRAKVREPNLEMLRKVAIDHISKCNGCEKCHRLRQKMRMKQAGMEPSQNSGSGTGQPPAKKPRNSRRNMNKSTAFEEGERVEVSLTYMCDC